MGGRTNLSTMFKKGKLVILLVLVLIVLLGYIFRGQLKEFILNRIVTDNDSEVELYVVKEQGLEGLKKQLINEHIIKSEFFFDRMASMKNFSAGKIATGKYIIASKTPIRNLINGFTENAQGNGNAEVEVIVSFDNCKTIGDMCGKVSKSLMCDSSELMEYISGEEVLSKYGFTSQQLPALFIPDSYRFFWDTDPKHFVARMAREFKEFWNDARKEKMNALGYSSPSQVVTLASIVYGEQSIVPAEWPVIARLYINRLKIGMRLQSDPTFKFCWGNQLDGVQVLNYVHRDIDCPYNTYKYAGLPPGPINFPPAGVVDAVLNPDQNNYLYMCAKPDFTYTHNFSKDYAVHQKYAEAYQKWIKSIQK